ncbi:CAP_ED domain-containing protein [Naegleria gruberi]|uniref:CAP_ED domain-containing protein n=1 Tax=Naegleria gruberi TaxID=5762 RepID=D2V111_NAEGR|nr:CAP_ED domain-containing protein [Naegleria gruberi]EFC49607.1 CAP_ED domain-containing protein [Naegleria gruberi]|eukprot:XP_002682351.1 CAP_ED domain-containing protein [Naegleria gruberi strain NEG-M]
MNRNIDSSQVHFRATSSLDTRTTRHFPFSRTHTASQNKRNNDVQNSFNTSASYPSPYNPNKNSDPNSVNLFNTPLKSKPIPNNNNANIFPKLPNGKGQALPPLQNKPPPTTASSGSRKKDISSTLDDEFGSSGPLNEINWERKTKKRLKPISAFITETINAQVAEESVNSSIVTTEEASNNGGGGTFLTELSRSASPIGMNSNKENRVEIQSKTFFKQNRAPTTNQTNLELYVEDPFDVTDRNSCVKKAISGTIRRVNILTHKKFEYWKNNSDNKFVASELLTKFPQQELDASYQRSLMSRAKELDDRPDFTRQTLELLFLPFKTFENNNLVETSLNPEAEQSAAQINSDDVQNTGPKRVADKKFEDKIDEELKRSDVVFKELFTKSYQMAKSTITHSSTLKNPLVGILAGSDFLPAYQSEYVTIAKPKAKRKVLNSDVWRNEFLDAQINHQQDLLNILDTRYGNRYIVEQSQIYLEKLVQRSVKRSERFALNGLNETIQRKPGDITFESFWDRYSKTLEVEKTQFYQTVLFYRRLLFHLETIQIPSPDNSYLIRLLESIRLRLIENPRQELTKEHIFFSNIKPLVEEMSRFDKLHPEDGGRLDAFFSNRETIKVIQFFIAELNINSDDLFTNFLLKLRIKHTKVLDELRTRLKERERQQQALIKKVDLFLVDGAEKNFIRAMVMALQPHSALAGSLIVKKGDTANEMFFILKGFVEVITEGIDPKVIATLDEGKFFGEVGVVLDQTRMATVRAGSHCDLFVLSKSALKRIEEEFPEPCQKIRDKAIERLNSVK